MEQAKFIEVCADVRYWEDATVNGKEDSDGTLIPFRKGNSWRLIIELDTGRILNWPEGVEADIHYKVCDAGEYWLLDDANSRIAKWNGYYVPEDILCVGDNGYGDYIIFKVGSDGTVIGWQKTVIKPEQWNDS